MITSILYEKNDVCSPNMFDLVIKQQYFFCSATIQDIVRRFKKKLSERGYEAFSDKIAIHLNDSNPAIGIIELVRVLVDEEGLTLH
jgi:starch phosphorylase